MAKNVTATPKAGATAQEPLVIGLADPGMTPLLRAGLGGLASSLRAMLLRRDPGATWPSPVEFDGAEARVEPSRVSIDWRGSSPEKALRVLFDESIGFGAHGLVALAGTHSLDRPFDVALGAALQLGLKRTFLQHGPVTRGKTEISVVSAEIDGQMLAVNVERYSKLVHNEKGPSLVAKALHDGLVELASWVYPGATERHSNLAGTSCEYSAGQCLAALFAIVGCLSFDVPRSGGAGVLVIVEPSDLIAFAVTRSRLTPRNVAEAAITGPSEAVLAVYLALRIEEVAGKQKGVAAAHGVALKTVAWSPKQKTRTRTVSATSVPDELLDTYEEIVHSLPNRIRVVTSTDEDAETGFFTVASVLRGFIAENLAAGRPWFASFASATVEQRNKRHMERRFIHYYWSRDAKNLGALRFEERQFLVAMLKHLEKAEVVLVRAVHQALRQRFGAIGEESKELSDEARGKRFKNERDRWRYAFAGSRTPQQIRAALADLWSRAGSNRELRDGWEVVLPLLRTEHWETARDLALVALASYQGASVEDDDSDATSSTDEP